MWLDQEVNDLKNTFLSESTLEDFLSDYEIDIIKENSTRYKNLHNGVIIPRHKRNVCFG